MEAPMSYKTRSESGQRVGNAPPLRLLTKRNIRFARRNWDVSTEQVAILRLTEELQLSVVAGDLRLLDGKWYVTPAGLLRIAHARGGDVGHQQTTSALTKPSAQQPG
jgi:hypothetical protein